MGFAALDPSYALKILWPVGIIIASLVKVIIYDATAVPWSNREAKQNQSLRCYGNQSLTTPARQLNGRAVSLHARTLAGHSGWRSESGARGQGLVASAPGRLWADARPALRPACAQSAGLGQATAE